MSMLYALLCLAALNAQPTASLTYQDRVGVCVHMEHVRKGGLDRVKELGIGWIRTDLNWESVERRKGEFDFSAYDRLFAHADRLGLKVLVILDYWHRFYDGPRMNTNVARRGFANYVAKALQRYKGRGFHWELWNEPNHPKFWHPKPDPDEYNALAREVQAVFADLAPGETLIGPALSHLDLDYLTALAPVLPKFAGVSFHPYRDGAPESIVPELDGLRQTLGHLTPQAPLVASEWGYSSARGRMTDDQHADHAMRTLLTGMVAGVQRTFWYDLMNDGDDPQEREHHFGLYKSDGTPKAAAKALAELGKSLRGHSYVGRFALASPQDFALLFAKADSYRWVAWTIRDRATQADLAVGVPEVRVVRPVQGASVKPSRSGRVSIPLGPRPTIVEVEGASDLLKRLSALGAAPGYALDPTQAAESLRAILAAISRAWPKATLAVEGTGAPRASGNAERVLAVLDATLPPVYRAATRQEATIRLTLTLDQGVRVAQVWRVRDPATVAVYPHDPLNGAFEVTLLPLAPRAATGTSSAKVGTTSVERPFVFDGRRTPVVLSLGAADRTRALRGEFRAHLGQGAPWVGKIETLQTKRFAPEDAAAFRSMVDADAGVAHSVTLSVTDSPPGLPGKALKVDYRLGAGRGFFEIRPPAGGTIPAQATSIGMWVHGDGSGHALRARIVDATGQFFQHDLGPIGFKGWRHLVVPLDNSARDRWGGANDGVLHFPVRLHSPLLIQPANGGAGTVYLGGYTVFSALRE